MKSQLSVLCSGTGYFSQFHYEAWNRVNGANVVAVCNRDIDKAEQFSKKYAIPSFYDSLEEAILSSQPDIVDVITPSVTHLDAVKLAAKHRVDVICQKPFGENIEQANEMVEIAQSAGIKLIIHENFRFMPWFRTVKKILNSGDLGHVLNAQFNLRPGDGQGEDAYMARQPYFQAMPKFMVHETGIHIVDVFRYLFGEPESIYAQLRKCNPVIAGEDSGVVVFEFENQLQAILDANRLVDHNTDNTRRTMGELNIIGTNGELKLDGEARIYVRPFGQQHSVAVDYTWNDQGFGGDCVFETIQHIAHYYLEGGVLENQGVEYLKNIRIEDAIYRSSEQGQKIVSAEF